ncbi:MAG: hypothetical protein HY329_06785 [Chloroflexi bacterium]|nr:hypothetical protein [Chloroflexota bacterium]
MVIPRPPESEAEVVAWLKTGLTNHGLRGRTVREILIDADGSYLSSPFRRQLEPTGTIWIGGRRPDPVASLRSEWANDDSLARHAIRGARTLGLIVAGGATLSGRAYADILRTLGFDLATARPLTSRSKRLVRDAPGYAAVLRSILLAQPAVELIVRALLKLGGGPVKIEALAHCATTIDEGLAQAVFGAPPVNAQPWYIRPSTRFNLKAGLYDVGVLDSKLAPGAGYRQMPNGPYDPGTDDWEIGKALLTGTHHVLDA